MKYIIVYISLILSIILLNSCSKETSNPVEPNNSLLWTKTSSGLTNTNVVTLVSSDTNLFAGTYGGGIFCSTNYGKSWNAVGTYLWNSYDTYALAISGTNVFAGTKGGGVYLSTDNGASWRAANSGLNGYGSKYVYALAVSGKNLLAGTEGSGVFLSTDNGTNWNPINSGLMNLTIQTLGISGTNFLAEAGNVAYISIDNGTNWSAINTGLPNNYITCFAVYNTNLYAGTAGGGIFLSTNNGTSWNAINSGLTGDYSNYVSTLCLLRYKSLCRDLWRGLSFHRLWH